jgi:hypothetical protein
VTENNKIQLQYFFFFAILDFELTASTVVWQALYHLSHSTSSFFVCVWYLQDRISQIICPGWLQTAILLLSTSRVARIKRMSHWHLTNYNTSEG